MSFALEGIKVLEMAAYIVGPSTGVLLSDFGAEVIKVEPPEGEPSRHVMRSGMVPPVDFNYIFEFANRNKQSLALDAKNPQAKEIIYKLVEKADVFLTNYRSAAIQKLAIDYETLSSINPRLIYTQIYGYGPKGPGKDWPAFDETAFWARSGIMGMLGEPDTPVPPIRGALGDLATSVMVFSGINLALYQREKTGKGQKVDSSLLSAGVWAAGWDLQRSSYMHEDILRHSRKEEASPLHNPYQTCDGRWIHLCMGDADRYWPMLCKALGREDLLKDPRFETRDKLFQNHELAITMLDDIFATKTLAELKESLDREGVVWAPAQSTLEVLNDPQVLENGYVMEYDHPAQGKFQSIDSPINLSASPKVRRPAPGLGEHTDSILRGLGYSPDRVAELRQQKVVF